MLRRLALADALILRPPHAPALPEGAEVGIIDSIRSVCDDPRSKKIRLNTEIFRFLHSFA